MGIISFYPFYSIGQQVIGTTHIPFASSAIGSNFKLKPIQKVQILKSANSEKVEQSESTVKFFPNPFTEKLTINFSKSENIGYDLKVFDLIGKLHTTLKFSLSNNELQVAVDLSQLKCGVYLIVLTSLDGTQLHKYKVVKVGVN